MFFVFFSFLLQKYFIFNYQSTLKSKKLQQILQLKRIFMFFFSLFPFETLTPPKADKLQTILELCVIWIQFFIFFLYDITNIIFTLIICKNKRNFRFFVFLVGKIGRFANIRVGELWLPSSSVINYL